MVLIEGLAEPGTKGASLPAPQGLGGVAAAQAAGLAPCQEPRLGRKVILQLTHPLCPSPRVPTG